MAEREQDLSKQPQQLHLTEGSSLRLTDGTTDVAVRKDGDRLFLQVSREEHTLFSIAVRGDGRVHQIFDAGAHQGDASEQLRALAGKEAPRSPEYQPITIEGFAGRAGSYRQSDIQAGQMEYYVYLYYRPAPDENWQYTIPYHVHFFGDQAEKLKEHTIAGGSRLRVSGELHTRQITSKSGKESKPHYDVYATQYEFFKGKPRPMEGETRRPG